MSKVWNAVGIIIFLIVMVLAIGFSGAGGGIANWFSLTHEQLTEFAAETNKNLPMIIDNETRLDSTTADPHKKLLTYSYTLVNYSIPVLDSSIAPELKEQVINSICSQKETNLLKENVTLASRYLDMDGRLVTEVIIHPKTCSYDFFSKSYRLKDE